MKIALIGYYNKMNFGDDFMALHLPHFVNPKGEHDLEILSDESGEIVKNGQEGYWKKFDLLVIGGGGIIEPNFWLFQNNGIEEIIKSQKPVVFLNVNVTESLINKKEFSTPLKSLNARWWVRDRQSQNYLSIVGIKNSHYLPDITFEKITPVRTVNNKKMTVFLNYYGFEKLTSYDDVSGWLLSHRNLREIAKFLDWMISFGWTVKFCCAQTSEYVDDRLPSVICYSSMQRKEGKEWQSQIQDCDSTLQDIQESSLVLSMRYHATTVALASSIPVMDICHHDKNRELLKDLNIKSISLDFNEISEEKLIKCVIRAENISDYEKTISNFRADSHRRWKLFSSEWEIFLKECECNA